MSSSIAFRRSPKPGAFTAATFSVPRSLLTTSVASASPSRSSAMTSSGWPLCATFSSTGSRSLRFEIFFSWMSTTAFSSTASIRSGSVTKYGDRYPRSNCIPSTTSSDVSIVLASSTVMTPSLPTFSIACAMMVPIVWSLLAEMMPTCATMFPLTGRLIALIAATTVSTALSMPRLSAIGFAPAATFFEPSRMIACASTVAVVVPSPAMSDVLLATSRAMRAPRFSTGSFRSISFATDTPSLVMVGEPNFLSRTTLRPFGPRVTLTASASWFTPRRSACRAPSL